MTPALARRMARYNSWQNASLIAAAGTLSDAARRRDRGAFFGSIAATFDHLLVDDGLWLARFAGVTRPVDEARAVPSAGDDWAAFVACRAERDAAIACWAAALDEAALAGPVAWYPAGGSVRVEKPAELCAAHLFNHQTHHRGQIHAMLTAAGAMPGPTDLPMMPDD
ncbi:MAG: DinB family protein [Pseudomonadota bacterium]